MKKQLKVGLSVAGGFTTLWTGSYFMGQLTTKDWQAFPTFMTTLLLVVGFVILGVFSACSKD